MFAENIECVVVRSAVIGLPGAAVTLGLSDKSAPNNTITISQGAVRHNLSVFKIKF